MLTKLPSQNPPVVRGPAGQALQAGEGVEAAQTACDGLTGLAQQMCYELTFGG